MFRRTGFISALALSSYLLCGFTAPQQCQTQPVNDHFGRDIALAAVGIGVVIVGTIVLVHEHNAHHRVKGCAFMGPNGLEVQQSDGKRWILTGATATIKPGDSVKVHGNRVKKDKAAADQTFTVEKLNKDYGACKVATVPAAAAAASASPAAE